MELRHLRYFVAVAELGSVSRAAERLFIAQPPLSMQIKQLEAELGVQLLIRYPRGVRLTPAGAAFLREATDVLARAERAKHVAREQGQNGGGYVRLGYVPSSGVTFMPRLIRRLRAERPDAELDLYEMISTRQLHALQHNEIDVGFVRHPFAATRLTQVAELRDHYYLAIPDGHVLAGNGPIDLRVAAHEVFVSPTRPGGPSFFDRSLALCADAEFSPNIRYEASSLFGVLTLVSAGLGVAIVPGSAVLMPQTGMTLRMLTPETRTGALAFVQVSGDPNPLVAALGEIVKDVFGELEAEIVRRIGALN